MNRWLSWARSRPRLGGALIGLALGSVSLGIRAVVSSSGVGSLDLADYLRQVAFGLIGSFVFWGALRRSEAVDERPDILVVLKDGSTSRERRDTAAVIVAAGARARFESRAMTRRRLEKAQREGSTVDFDPQRAAFPCFRVWLKDAFAPDLMDRLREMAGVEDVVRMDKPTAPAGEILQGPRDADGNEAGTTDLSVRGWRPGA